jgi:hypothetical protein
MLTYAEEILLLALDDRTGLLRPLPDHALRYALTGALLLELAIAGRIDTDLDGLYVIDASPTDEPLLDDLLQRLNRSDVPRTTTDWLNQLAWDLQDLSGTLLDRLVEKGLLRMDDRRILWVFGARRYPLQDDQEIREVSSRLRDLITSDAIPDPDDAALIALVEACQLWDALFTEDELMRLRPRIEALVKLDLIGREVVQAISTLSRSLAEAIPPFM